MSDTHKWTQGIGARIKSIRRKAQLDQLEFGSSIGVVRQSISGYETERLMPSRKLVERMSDTYGVTPWWLLYGPPKGEGNILDTLLVSKTRQAKLTSAQQTLIRYIQKNETASDELVNTMFNRAINS